MKKLLLAVFLLAQTALAADQALTQCRKIVDIEERVACYDAIIDARYAMESEAVVTAVRASATGKLTVTLDNGQVWQQLDNRTLRLKSGETVIVRKASLGSYLLEKQSGGRRIRVKRAN